MIVNHDGRRQKVEVTRKEFEEATAPLLLRTRTTTEIVVLSAGLQWAQIDKVLLVGGSTRMPQVSEMLVDLTGKTPDRSISADEAVAHGAALYADLLVQRHGLGAGSTQFSITNVNSHSLGVVGVEPGTGRKVNAVLIPKNSPLPKSAARRFKTAKPNQPNVRIVVVEGESEMPEACTEVGVAIIRDLPPNLPAGWPVEVRFEYAENGSLTVGGKLSGHESVVTTEFVRDNSLSDDDLMLWAESLEKEARHPGS
jgi:molecular chaperone DnaK